VIDFHCHLDLYPDPPVIVERCRRAGAYVLSVTTTPRAWRGTSKLTKDCPRIRTALGLHPQLAHERLHELALFEGLLPEARYVGEIGLDGASPFRQHWHSQTMAFERVLGAVSRSGGRVMSVHSRRAADEVLDALDRFPDAGVAVLHWFSGTKRQLQRAIDRGCWFSVGPAMLCGKAGAALAKSMPRDRVLTESDGPFATTASGPLTPEDVHDAITALASIWEMSAPDVDQLLRGNLRILAAAAKDEKVTNPQGDAT